MMTISFPRMLRRSKDLALVWLLVFENTGSVQSPWPCQASASWELASSKQLGLDHRKLEASGVLYLKTRNLSGCRLQAR